MNQTEDILIKYLSGNCSPEEVREVEDLLMASADFKQQYDSLAQVFELTENIGYVGSDTNTAWQEFEANVKAPNKTLGFDWLKVAASIVLLAAFSVAIFSYLDKGNSYTSKNDPLPVDLVDHSLVVLNENSILTTNKGFNENHRSLQLDGEAYFKVEKAEHPFTLDVGLGVITVTGTAFNVMSNATRSFLSIELYEGSVEFTRSNGELIVLKAGDRFELYDGESHILKLGSELPYWYNSSEINCDDVSLMEIMLQLEKQYQVGFKIPKRKLKDRYTVALPKDDLQTCIQLISEISDINLKLKDNQITSQ